MGSFSIIVDEDKGFYKKRNLNLDEVNYLFHRNYKEYSFYSILSNKKEKYMLRPRYNESPQHCFLTFEIAEFLKKFADKVELFETKKPDIIFEINGKGWAVEVETGKFFTSNRKKILEKVRNLKQVYGKNWFFVVTNRNYASRYSKLGKTYDKRYIARRIIKIARSVVY